MLIELNVFYYPDDYDPDEYKSLGKKPEITQGLFVLNTDHIVGYNPHDSGDTMIRLSNGENFQSSYPFKEFDKLMKGMDFATKMLITDEN